MIPIVTQLKRPSTVLKSMPLRMVPVEKPQQPESDQIPGSSLMEDEDKVSDENCTHIMAQISRSQFKVYKVQKDVLPSGLSLDVVSTLPIYSKIFFWSRIREKERDYAFVVSEDLSLSLVGLENAESDQVKILSYMPLDNLEPSVIQLMRLERHVTHFVYHSGSNKSRAILTFEGSDWLMVVHFKKNLSGQLELVDFELDQVDGLKDAIDITSCSATDMKGWPDETCQWLIFTMTRPSMPYDFSRDVMLSKNYEFQKNKLEKKREELVQKINRLEKTENDDDDEQIGSTTAESERKQLREIEDKIKKLKNEFEDVASDDEGHTFAQAIDEGEQQVLRVYRYGSPNFEQQQEMQIELVQTSSFIFDYEILFPSTQLFVKFLTLNCSKPDRPNFNDTVLMSTSDGLCYLDVIDKQMKILAVEGGQSQKGLVHSEILPFKQRTNFAEITCILKSENILQNSSQQWIDIFEGYSMVVIDLKGKEVQGEVVPFMKVFRENQEVLNALSDLQNFNLLQSQGHDLVMVNQQLTKVLQAKVVEGNALPVLSVHEANAFGDDTNLDLSTEVLDVQTSSQNGSLIYHGTQKICMKSLNPIFRADSIIKFEKNCFLDNLNIVQVSEKLAIMLTNEYNSDGISSISAYIGQRWDEKGQTPFEFRRQDSSQLSEIANTVEAGIEQVVMAWFSTQFNSLVKQNESNSSLQDIDVRVLDFYIANQSIVLISSSSISIKNYRTGIESTFSTGSNTIIAKHDQERIILLDEDNLVTFFVLDSMNSPVQSQTAPRPQTIRVSPDEQIHDICIFESIIAMIFFDSPVVRFYDGTESQFELDLTTILPFEVSQVQPDKIEFLTLKNQKKESHFFTVTLTNGQIVKFGFNPNIIGKLQMIQNTDEKKQIISVSLVKFLGIQKLGNFIKCQVGNIFVTDSDELYEGQLRQQFDQVRSLLSLQKVSCDIMMKPSYSPFGPVVLKNDLMNVVKIHQTHVASNDKQVCFALLIRDCSTNNLTLHLGQLMSRNSRSKLLDVPPQHKIQKMKIVEKLNLIAVCCYRDLPESMRISRQGISSLDLNAQFDNQILLINSGSGEQLSDAKRLPQSQIPMHIEYLEAQEIMIVGTNRILNNISGDGSKKQATCAIKCYHLFNKEGMLGLFDAMTLKYRQGSIMDIKQFTWFDRQTYIAVAIHNFVQIYRISIMELGERKKVKLIPVLKIEQQIGIYKIQIKLNDQPSNKYMEIMVSDVLKSLIVYQVDYDEPLNTDDDPWDIEAPRKKSPSLTDKIKDGIQTHLMRRKTMAPERENRYSTLETAWKQQRIKYKFPYGQWCTGAEKINDVPNDNGVNRVNLYAASFFDENFVIMAGKKNEDSFDQFRQTRSQYLSVIAASNLQDQITSMVIAPKGMPAVTVKGETNLKNKNQIDPSLIFISTPYLQNHQLPTKLQSSFFDASSKFIHMLSQADMIQANPSLLYSTSSSGLFLCNFCQDQALCDILSATQDALSNELNLQSQLTDYAQTQLVSLLDDKIAFNEKFQSFQDNEGRLGASTQVLDLNEFLGVKKKDFEMQTDESGMMISGGGQADGRESSAKDLKNETFLKSRRANVHGLEDMRCRPIIFSDFLERLLDLPYEQQEKITFKVKEAINEKNQSTKSKTKQTVNIEVRELVGLIAALTRQI